MLRQKFYRLLLIAVVTLLFLAGWSSYAQKETPAAIGKVAWEYKVIRADRALTEATLNDLGMYGWELILFDDGERGDGSYGGTYYFKRLK
jgi:hypothetical protein